MAKTQEKSREALLKPIQPNEIEWRVQNSKDGKMIVVPYITNRCVMDRFDEAFGWDGWSSSFREIDGGFICRIELKDGTYKEDGAGRTNIEQEKGGISTAMKRCAVHFGLGRDLYKYPKVYVYANGKYIPDWAKDKLEKLVVYINEGKLNRDLVVLKEE